MELIELKNSDHRDMPAPLIEQLDYIPGVWINGNCYWLKNSSEKVIYDEEVIVKVKQEQIHLKIRFFNLYVSNHSSKIKEMKVLTIHHCSHISPDQFSFVSPVENVVFHLTDKNVYLVNGQSNGVGIVEYSIQPYRKVFTDQVWNCQEKGNLKYQPMAKGDPASILAMKIFIKPYETVKISTWSIKGKSKNELILLDKALLATRKG
jgi:hypothetical protein